MSDEDEHYYKLDGTEHIQTFGGESWIDDWRFADYGISFEKCAVTNLTPEQMIGLACIMVDHLLINGHRFEIRKTYEQDQTERLVCLDAKEENNDQ